MNIEYTLSIMKPDVMQRNLTEEINKMFIDAGLEIVAQKEIKLTQEMAEEFYGEHKGKPFYENLVGYMSSTSVIVQVLSGPNAVLKNREIMGATNPKDAAKDTIREKYGVSIDHNSVHGSDSLEAAQREISFFFDYDKITGKN